MSNEFKNRVFGAIILKSINSNFNADFTHHPRTLPDGVVYSTDKALKYSIKNYLKNFYPTENLFYIKRYNDKLNPLSLDETYERIFNKFPSKPIEKFSLFYFDGDKIEGVLPEKPKEINSYFKGLSDESGLKAYQKKFEILSKTKEVKYIKIDEAQKFLETLPQNKGVQTLLPDEGQSIEEESEFYFYIDKSDSVKKIEGNAEELAIICKNIFDLTTGGIDKFEVLRNLMSCIDIRLFGATFAGKTNISIHGPVQINHGVNKFPENYIVTEDILSPFRNPGEKGSDEKAMSTIGNQTNLKEGHYVFHFSINPKNTDEFYCMLNKNKPEEEKRNLCNKDISKLKEAFNNSVTALDSSRKIGTENETTLWIQLKEGSKKMLPSLTELIEVNENREIDFSKVSELIYAIKEELEFVEIYYNPSITTIKGLPKEEYIKFKNIINNEEI